MSINTAFCISTRKHTSSSTHTYYPINECLSSLSSNLRQNRDKRGQRGHQTREQGLKSQFLESLKKQGPQEEDRQKGTL